MSYAAGIVLVEWEISNDFSSGAPRNHSKSCRPVTRTRPTARAGQESGISPEIAAGTAEKERTPSKKAGGLPCDMRPRPPGYEAGSLAAVKTFRPLAGSQAGIGLFGLLCSPLAASIG